MAVGEMDSRNNHNRRHRLSLVDALKLISARVPVQVIETVLSHAVAITIGIEIGIHAQTQMQTENQNHFDHVTNRAISINAEMRAKLQKADDPKRFGNPSAVVIANDGH